MKSPPSRPFLLSSACARYHACLLVALLACVIGHPARATSAEMPSAEALERWSMLVAPDPAPADHDVQRSRSPYFMPREALQLSPGTAIGGEASRQWSEADVLEDPAQVKRAWRERLPPDAFAETATAHAAAPSEDGARSVEQATPWQRVYGAVRTSSARHQFAGRLTRSQSVFDHALGYRTTYAGASSGGLWKIVVAGLFPIWVPISESLDGSPSVGDFAAHPSDSRRLIIGTGDRARYGGSGIYWSANGGATWQAATMSPRPGAVTRIRVDRSQPNRVLACTTAGIFRSLDFGQSWTRVWTGDCTDLIQDQSAPIFWFAARAGHGILESDDFGSSFREISAPFGADAERISLASPVSAGNVLFSLATNGGGLNGIWRSTDYGRNWVNINTTDLIGWGQAFHTAAIEVHPYAPNIVVIGLAQDQFTTNAMASASSVSWSIFDGGHVDFTSFRFLADSAGSTDTRIAITNDGGYFTWDYADFSTAADGIANGFGLQTTQVFGFAGLSASPTSAAIVYHALQDNGTVRARHSGSVRQDLVTGGDGGQVSMSPTQLEHVAFSYGLPWRRAISLDGGTTNSTIDCGMAIDFTPSVVFDPVPGTQQLFASSAAQLPSVPARLWRKTADSTCNWQAVNSLALPLSPLFRPHLIEIANTAAAYVIYLTGAFDSRVIVLDSSVHGGPPNMQWALRTPPLPAGSTRNDGFAYADRFRGNTVYYVTGIARPSRLFRSRDRGLNWEDVTGNFATLIPDAHVWSLLAHPTRADELYAGTLVGVYRSDDGGRNWYRFMRNMPAVLEAKSMAINGAASPPELIVSSYGHGLWKRALERAPLVFRNSFE
jgi:hypothetical protein